MGQKRSARNRTSESKARNLAPKKLGVREQDAGAEGDAPRLRVKALLMERGGDAHSSVKGGHRIVEKYDASAKG